MKLRALGAGNYFKIARIEFFARASARPGCWMSLSTLSSAREETCAELSLLASTSKS
jgi:hypothetical protein